jgi:phosphate starvation-inducible PhoH-like protein
MIEKILYLKGIDPVVFYGQNNLHIEILKHFFPKLKIIARGDQVKAIGNTKEIELFEEKLNRIFSHINQFNKLDQYSLEGILGESSSFVHNDKAKDDDIIVFGNSGKPIRARTPHQKVMVEEFKTHDLLFATGPAGSGKTYMAVALAVHALRNKEVKRIILSRPAVESGEQLGFLPGDLREKLDPYLQPLYDALLDLMPAKKLADYMDDNTIQIAPLAFMRGRTLENSFVILDEAQNATINQLKMFLTRMGNNSKFIVTGDITQIDLQSPSKSGLVHAHEMLRGISGIAIVDFDKGDIIRHKLVARIVQAYEENQNGGS